MNNAQRHGCKYEGWQCFHCGEVFTTAGGAAVHFGEISGSKPGCLRKVELGNERGWLMEIRDLENKLTEWRDRAFFFEGECDRLTESKDTLRQKLEQAEARCAELHQAAYPLYSWCAEHLTYQQFNEAYNYGHYLGMVIEKHNPAVGAIILRKQAEAVIEFGHLYGPESTVRHNSQTEAQRLRQQATEIESGGSDG